MPSTNRSQPSSTSEISYSDGSVVEADLLALVESHSELSADSAIGQERYASHWPARCHLSPERSNLLRHLNFEGLSVLEIGAGMGAVSRHLAEQAKSLTIVEGTAARYRVLASRLRDLDNWTAHVASLESVTLPEKCDVVCIVGVLEYAELYSRPPADFRGGPFAWFLKTAASHLKEDGVLILAIENRLGLKYWSGAAEDHTGKMFDGICGYSGESKSPRTFSRGQVRSLLNATGLAAVEEHFPFPDYKVPKAVISLELMQKFPDLAAGLATLEPYANYELPRVRFFPEALAVASVSDAGLLPEFSNSFLFIASRNEESVTYQKVLSGQRDRGELAWSYANFRRIPTTTVFSRLPDRSRIEVNKRALRTTARQDILAEGPGMRLQWNPLTEPALVDGVETSIALLRRAYFGGEGTWHQLLVEFLRWSFSRWRLDDSPPGHMDGCAIDAIINNSRRTEGTDAAFELFDLEWTLLAPMPKSWFILRNVLYLRLDCQLRWQDAAGATPSRLYETVCRELGIAPDLEFDISREAEFQTLTTNRGPFALHRASIRADLNARLPHVGFPRQPVREELYIRALVENRWVRSLLRSAQRVRNATQRGWSAIRERLPAFSTSDRVTPATENIYTAPVG